ncbi:DUF3828 domain-containing protein [Citrobacter sp. ku-bf4]|uniref:DUF3828 domain-containing protein n=1 Tax=Citrobacter TaxID=544 RepID=UPI001982379D|nr:MULTISPECIES: DUF3828 domain-containing protein [Citrobacter]MBN6043560.1 DUF3828 domain-containing protein [Citrobacter sp. ku-bf4]MBS0824937.1 DUF3828 domain-containing protein [Citrobacter amalonaticus]
MKKIAFLLFFSATAMGVENMQIPMQRALEFNRWYIKQVNNDHYPIKKGDEIDQFVTAGTMKKLRHADDPRYAEDEFYEADFFLKSQYIDDDWPDNVVITSYYSDPVCVNVNITFGKKKPHTVIDCMVKEDGAWKVQSVAARDFN